MAHQTTNPDRDYDRLQRALDRQVTGAPASATFTQILRLLYAPDEAALAARCPTADWATVEVRPMGPCWVRGAPSAQEASA